MYVFNFSELHCFFISPLCLVWVRALHSPNVRQAKFCLRVCWHVFFLGILQFSPHLLIGPSHKSRNNLEKHVSLKISLSSRVLHMFLLLDYNRLLSSTFSCCKSWFRFVPLFINTSVDNYTLRNETEQVPIM